MLLGMGAIIVGNGYFKANISTIVGKLYEDGDARRDSGFTIFYIGINVGALGATTIVAYVGEVYGFDKGFALAGLGMLLGFFIFWFGKRNYEAAAGLDIREEGKKKVLGPINMVQVITILSLLVIPACYFLINQNEILKWGLLGLFLIVAFNLITAGSKAGKEWRDRMIALVIFMVINIVFWACFEQAGTSLTLFADRNVDREIFGWLMPASMTQFFNPFFIIVFGSIFSVMWIKLTKIGKNPSIPIKFALGIFQLGLGFLVTLIGLSMESQFQVPLLTLVFLYLLHTTGELFISPIGLSMVTKLAPKNIAGTAMGGWFLSFAIANFLGGQIAALTGAEGHGEEDNSKQSAFNMDTTVEEAIEMEGTLVFEDWVMLQDEPLNISLKKYVDVKDWVEYREQANTGTFEEWKNTRSMNTPISSAKDWLNKNEWTTLNEKYAAIKSADKAAAENAGLDYGSWLYFRDGFSSHAAVDASLSGAFGEYQAVVSEKGLNKYVSIFSTIGYILIGFSLLIVLLAKPLNRLMHGVV